MEKVAEMSKRIGLTDPKKEVHDSIPVSIARFLITVKKRPFLGHDKKGVRS